MDFRWENTYFSEYYLSHSGLDRVSRQQIIKLGQQSTVHHAVATRLLKLKDGPLVPGSKLHAAHTTLSNIQKGSFNRQVTPLLCSGEKWNPSLVFASLKKKACRSRSRILSWTTAIVMPNSHVLPISNVYLSVCLHLLKKWLISDIWTYTCLNFAYNQNGTRALRDLSTNLEKEISRRQKTKV